MSEEVTLDDFNPDHDQSTKQSPDVKVGIGDLQQLETSPFESWDLVKIGEILSLEYGNNLPTNSRKPGSVPVYGSNGIVDTHSEAAVDRPGIVLGRKGSIGEIDFSDKPFWPIDTTYYITNEETDQNLRFLYYLLQNIQLERLNAASAIPGLNRNDTYGLNAVIPPLEEQRKIASVLYNVDQAIQKTKKILEETERNRKGLRQDLFSHGIDSTGQLRSENQLKEIYLGEVPEEWELRRVDEVCSNVVDCPHSTPKYTSDGVMVIRTSEIENGRFDSAEAPRVTEEGYQERISRLEPQPGDVIFTREAPIGEAFKIPEGMRLCLGQRLVQLRPEDGILDPDFLVELIYSDMMQSWFERSARGSTSKHINVEDIKSLAIPIPSFEEQQRIDSILGTYREYSDIERGYLNRLRRIKQGLMQDLLSGKVRTTDTNIEVLPEVAAHG